MNSERLARALVVIVIVALPLALLLARRAGTRGSALETRELHARMADAGGWTPGDLIVDAGQPLRLRLTSDDVVHGFAVGQTNWPALDVKPGQVTETTLTFTKAGRYVFYCTRWCGVDHWRMRGTIDVKGARNEGEPSGPSPVTPALDLDSPHRSSTIPTHRPSAARGDRLGIALPTRYRMVDVVRRHSPVELWTAVRQEPTTRNLSDADVWDLVALALRQTTTLARLEEGRELYATNCAACHGERGHGDGVFAERVARRWNPDTLHQSDSPADFTDPQRMLGASPLLLHGKIVRGGMGTSMPYWGPIFSEPQLWALVEYVWSFQFELKDQHD